MLINQDQTVVKLYLSRAWQSVFNRTWWTSCPISEALQSFLMFNTTTASLQQAKSPEMSLFFFFLPSQHVKYCFALCSLKRAKKIIASLSLQGWQMAIHTVRKTMARMAQWPSRSDCFTPLCLSKSAAKVTTSQLWVNSSQYFLNHFRTTYVFRMFVKTWKDLSELKTRNLMFAG